MRLIFPIVILLLGCRNLQAQSPATPTAFTKDSLHAVRIFGRKMQQYLFSSRAEPSSLMHQQKTARLTGTWLFDQMHVTNHRRTLEFHKQGTGGQPEPSRASGQNEKSGKTFLIDHTGFSFPVYGSLVHSGKQKFFWTTRNDTLVIGMAPEYFVGDTIISCYSIQKCTDSILMLQQFYRENVSEPLPCVAFASPTNMLSRILAPARPVDRPASFPGNMQNIFNQALKEFTPDKDYYRSDFDFMVNCYGEVTEIPYAQDKFDLEIKKVLKTMGRWLPASTNEVPGNMRLHLSAEWTKGFVDIEITPIYH